MSWGLWEAWWQEARASQGWGWSLRTREVTHPPTLGQGLLFSLPSPCRCWRCYREARIHPVLPLCSPGCGLLEGRHSPGLASRWGSAPRLSTSGPEETIPSLSSCSVLYLLMPCEKSPVAGAASSPAAVRAVLPCPTPAGSAVLQCSPADCPLPGCARCSFTCKNTQSSCPSECIAQSRARCCYRGHSAHIYHAAALFPSAHSVMTLEKPGLCLACTPCCLGLLQLLLPIWYGAGFPLRTTTGQGKGLLVLPSNTCSLQLVWIYEIKKKQTRKPWLVYTCSFYLLSNTIKR